MQNLQFELAHMHNLVLILKTALEKGKLTGSL